MKKLDRILHIIGVALAIAGLALTFNYSTTGFTICIVALVVITIAFTKKRKYAVFGAAGIIICIVSTAVFCVNTATDGMYEWTSKADEEDKKADANPEPTTTVKSTATAEPTDTVKPTTTPKTKEQIAKEEKEKKDKEKKEKEKFISECKTYKYKTLMRNPKKYEGKKIKLKATIDQKMQDGEDISYRVYTLDDYGYYDKEYFIVDFRESKEPILLEEDVITIYGLFYGTSELERVEGNIDQVATICMKYVKLSEE